MSRPGRPKDHVHNWQMRMTRWSGMIKDPTTGWDGFYADRYWECVRGGIVKHTSPSKDYPFPTNLFGRKWNEDFHPANGEQRVFLPLSGVYDFEESKRGII